MAIAICKVCGKKRAYLRRRRFKIEEQRCDCGGELGPAKWIGNRGMDRGRCVLLDRLITACEPPAAGEQPSCA